MPAVARAGDEINTGHGCDATAPIDAPTTGLANKVFINGIGAACKGDLIKLHWIQNPSPPPPCVPHPAQIIKAGSGTVFVGGVAIARVGDSADLGAISKGSPNVNAGG